MVDNYMGQVEDRDIVAYMLARKFLLGFEPVTEDMLRGYMEFSDNPEAVASIKGVYRQLVASAQNASMKSGVVGRAIGGIEKLGQILCQFDPAGAKRKYGSDSTQLLDDIVAKLRPRGQVRRSPRSIWPGFCRSVLSAADFLSQFTSIEDFISWIDFFDRDDRARPTLPMLLASEVYGIATTLLSMTRKRR